MRELPTGTITLLFTDIEGSTSLLQQVGHRYDGILTEYRQLLRAAFHPWNGYEVDTQGDAFFVTFSRAIDGVCAAVEGQVLITKVGDRAWSAECLWVAALLALSEGEPRGASSLAQESLSIYREMGDPWYSAWSLHHLGRIEIQLGEMPAARNYYQQSLALNQQVGEKWMTPFNLEGLASVVAINGALRWAAQLWGAVEALREAIDVPRLPVDRIDYEQAVTGLMRLEQRIEASHALEHCAVPAGCRERLAKVIE